MTGAVVQGEGVLLAARPADPPSLQPQQASAGPPVTVPDRCPGAGCLPPAGGGQWGNHRDRGCRAATPAGGIGAISNRGGPDRATGHRGGGQWPASWWWIARLRAVVRIDPVGGSAAIIADTDTGGGPPFVEPLAIAVEATGRLVVVDGGLGAVLRVDPQTGDRRTRVRLCQTSTPRGAAWGELSAVVPRLCALRPRRRGHWGPGGGRCEAGGGAASRSHTPVTGRLCPAVLPLMSRGAAWEESPAVVPLLCSLKAIAVEATGRFGGGR